MVPAMPYARLRVRVGTASPLEITAASFCECPSLNLPAGLILRLWRISKFFRVNGNFEVDEKGFRGTQEAVAGFAPRSIPPVISIDSPFIFLVTDQKNNVLNIGRVVNPNDAGVED
jgi:hypothetical protein